MGSVILYSVRSEIPKLDSTMANSSNTNKAVLEKYLSLPQGTRVCATYVWIDGSGESMRSKVKCLDSKPSKVEDLPVWNYDGSSCYQSLSVRWDQRERHQRRGDARPVG